MVVTQKTPEEQIKSWQKRGLNNVAAIKKKIEEVDQMFAKTKDKYSDQIFVINYTELVENTDAVMEETYAFLGLRWKPEYKTMEAFNAKGRAIGRPPEAAFHSSASKQMQR